MRLTVGLISVWVIVQTNGVVYGLGGKESEDKRLVLEDNYQTIINRLDTLTKETESLIAANMTMTNQIETMANQIESLKTTNNALTSEVNTLKANIVKRHSPVAFLAYLTTTLTGQNHHIYYDSVKLNIGNAYNPHHGTFVAPVNGTYIFTVSACTTGGHYIGLNLMVNNIAVGSVYADDSSWYDCNSNTFVVSLQANDDVYVKHETIGDYLMASQYGLPMFNGVLIQAF